MTKKIIKAAPLPAWMDWMLGNTQSGLLLLDAECRVVYLNHWLVQRAHLGAKNFLGEALNSLFPTLEDSHFERALQRTLKSGFPCVLAQSLHPAPFPLYAPGVLPGEGVSPLRQSIYIIPMGAVEAAKCGQRYTMVQISDVSSTVARERVLKAHAEKLNNMAHMDALTGIGNRRFFDEAMVTEMRTAARTHTAVSLVLLDLDHFKRFNDQYGHQEGDRCLRAVAEVLRKVCKRPRDVLARYGGEEMAVVLPDTDAAGAVQVATEILQQLQGVAIPHEGNKASAVVTASAGVCTSDPHEVETVSSLIRKADQALYAAKKAGRNRLFVYDNKHGQPLPT